MDEEELQKRLTDCVYFLASPLTCKKGIECEYRHSEIARLNPRDCWYWLAGSCFNPDCAFRHPPLEGFKEVYCESADPNHGPPLHANKTNIPCFFYSNGFCNKGDRCSFLHGPADGSHDCKSSKAASTVNNAVSSEKKLSAGSNTGSTPIRSHPDPFETAQIGHAHTESKPTRVSLQLASRSTERSESPDIKATQCQENIVRADLLLPQEEFVQNESVFTEQGSDEQAIGYVEQEEWLESSPGFDVLVEGESERLGYEEDADYFPVHDEEGRELDVRYVEYDRADPIEYDPVYPELGNPLREERNDVYDRLDNKQVYDYLGKITGQSRESIFCRLSFHKRNLEVEPIFSGRRGPDLRERLKKRKVGGDCFRSCFSQGHGSPHPADHRLGRNSRRHGSHGEIGIDHRGSLRKIIPVNRYRQPPRDKRPGKPHFLSSEVSRSRKPALQQKRTSQEESAFFPGPKTLDQIKEEKKKALQNRDLPSMPGPVNRTASDGFQGPRPLSEILENKRKLGSVVDCYGNRN